MSVSNSRMSRLASFIFPWSSDLGACPKKSVENLEKYKVETDRFSCLDKDVENITFDLHNCSNSFYVKSARYFKLAIGAIGLIVAAILLSLGLHISSSALFYAGVGSFTFSTSWFLCLVVRNQTTGQGLPSYLPYVGGWRIRNR